MASKKLGHLEAGRKKLEEFRRKKEGRAKKAASTGQLASTEEVQQNKVSQNNEPREAADFNTHTLGISDENDKVSSSESTKPYASSRSHGSSPVLVEDNHASKWNESSGVPSLVNGYYNKSEENSQKSEAGVEPNTTTNITESIIHPIVETPYKNDRYSSEVRSDSDRVSEENNWGLPPLPSNPSYSSRVRKESSPKVDLYSNSNAKDYSVGGGKMVDSFDYKYNVNSTPWRTSEPAYSDSSSAYKGMEYDPYSSANYGTSAGRSRPSFLDSIGVSRTSLANTSAQYDKSEVQSTEIPWSHSSAHKISEFNTMEESSTHDPINDKELSLNNFVSSNDGYATKENMSFTSNKNEDFAALEQHIEDLTQEKFSLQRALETSRTLAESLAAENSSLTESYNQQGQTVNQLRYDMEKLHEEIDAQLLALESLRSEYMNAQLECNAADERAKILASEVIGLEEKALRLRSNELKLEKHLDELKSEVASYKRKVSILEKERQDFQLTIDALQEEKKVLHYKMQRVSSHEKVHAKAACTTKDVSTSTEDLGDTSISDRQSQENASVPKSTDASSSFMVAEDNNMPVLDASLDIPHDQLRMIENINSLISELALEKDELVEALKIESSNCIKLKDLNKELSQKLEAQTQRLELLTAQSMANNNSLARTVDTQSIQDSTQYADEGDEVVERVLGWIMKLFPGGPSKRRTSKLL